MHQMHVLQPDTTVYIVVLELIQQLLIRFGGLRSLDLVWVMIDELGHDFEVEKHILYLLGNAEKHRVPLLSELVLWRHNTELAP